MDLSIKDIFRSPPVLVTERLKLRKIEKADRCDMFEFSSDPELTRFLTWEPHPDLGYTAKYLSYVQSQYRAGKFFDWAVTLSEKMIGTCGFTALDEYNLCGEMGYVISSHYHGQGYATEAAMRVIRFGFEELGLRRIESRYMIGNDASRRVMEKCGMTFEGVRRQSLYIKGRYVDVGTCSILDTEYKAMRSK
ncbi:MAG: GNAT family N-acetyltransferase [Clostridia bacterium]|nr:GNAT family N-acetyltransferase [Clostridia bacterium]